MKKKGLNLDKLQVTKLKNPDAIVGGATGTKKKTQGSSIRCVLKLQIADL